ncbi:MAG: hypothetical protein ACRETB_04690 [Steroidobacteraceae bacterium]
MRYAKRAVLEIEAHHRDLLEEARARGESAEEARRGADAAIGTEDTLIERFASRKELRSWSHRWPVGYGLAPLVCFGGSGVALMCAVWAAMYAAWPHPQNVEVSASLAADINVALVALFLWILPISVAMAFGVVAYRQRISLRWPVVGILLLCTAAALVNVGFGVRGGPKPLFLDAGIGFGTKMLPQELARALSKAIPALIPLAWMKYRTSRKFRSESGQPSLS